MIRAQPFMRYFRDQWFRHPSCVPPLAGCTYEEINAMCAGQQVAQLPHLYIHFMLTFGWIPAGLQNGGIFTFPEVLDFKKRWDWLLPSEDCFVFMSHEVSSALFFHTNKGDNPMIFSIHEATEGASSALFDINALWLLEDFFLGWLDELLLEIELYGAGSPDA
jgi:hypothetical protein